MIKQSIFFLLFFAVAATTFAVENVPDALPFGIKNKIAAPLVAEKGSIAVDGVSLTVSELREEGFCVSLIPETRERTNLGQTRLGAAVNLEVDVIAKHIEKLMSAGARI